jgi:hypothetical protein
MEAKTNYSTTKELVISTQLPQMTRTYKPFSNQRIIDLTLNGISNAGFTLDKERYTCAKEGLVCNGKYTIGNVSDGEMQLQISWLNSYDKSKPLSFFVGALITVCNNGLQRSMGMGGFKKKHQGQIQEFTPTAITEYIKGAQETFIQIQKERDIMKEVFITRDIQARLIGEMFLNEDFVKSTQLNIIKREIHSPTHSYGDPNSLWSLYQYTSFAMRDLHPSLSLQDHLDAHTFFINAAGILVTPSVNPSGDMNQLALLEETHE